MKTWLKRFSFGFFGLLLCLFFAGWFLLASQSGTDFIVSQVVKKLNGQVQIGAARGKVLDRLELSDVVFNSPGGKAELSRFVLDWKSTALLHLHLHILELTADDVSYTVIPQETDATEPSSEPLILPALTLPITITLEKLDITNVVFVPAPTGQPIIVNDFALSLFWDKSGIQLEDLSVIIPEGKLQSHGQLNPIAHYPLQLQTELQIMSADLPFLDLHGEFSGDLQELFVQLDVSGDINAELDLTAKKVINNPSWQGALVIKELRPAIFSSEIPGVLTGALQTHGDLQQAAVTGSLAMRDTATPEVNWDTELDIQANLQTLLFTVKQLSLNQANTTAKIELSGTASVDQDLDLHAHWQNLQWPVVGEAEFVSSEGESVLTGRVDDYLLSVKAALNGTQLPDGTWQLEAKGNSESAKIVQLNGNILDGVLSFQGEVQWKPQVMWKLNTEAKGINPEELSADWPGKFDWLLQTEGTLAEKGVNATVTLKQLQGTLRDLPVSGSADVAITPYVIDVHGLQLRSGTAEITATGSLGESSAIDWNISVPDFSDLLPNSAGTLTAQGMVKGAIRQPQIKVQASADSIIVSQTELEQLQADVDLDLSWTKPFSVRVTGLGLKSGENLLRQFQLTGNGTLDEHTLVLSASHNVAEVGLALEGGYSDDQWQGLLNTLKIDGTDIGSWQLEQPVKIAAATTAAVLEKMCLAREEAELCLDASWDGKSEKTKANVDLSGFALAWLSQWFPDTLQSLDGSVSVQGSVAMAEKIQADVVAEITPGSLVYKADKEITGTIPHEGGKLNIHIADDGVAGDFLFNLDSNVLKGNVNLPDVLQVEETGDARLTAELFIDAEKLDVVESLVADVQDLDASLKFHFTVGGSLNEPDVNGSGKLNVANILIPAAGLDLKDTVFDIVAANKEMTLKGIFHSPGGSLALDGRAVLDAQQNWPARFTLKADMFRLIDLPEKQVFVNSDLVLEKKAERIRLSGDLTIPKAEVLIRELAKGSETVSPDVVILQKEKEKPEEPKSPLEMDLKVTLGNAVHFVGFGVNGFIDGQLTLTAKPEDQMRGGGEFHIKQGTYRAYGQDLDIERGVISFPGGPLTKPGIDLRATRTVGQIVAGINAIGPLLKPRLTTFSKPAMSESATISYLLTGRAPEGESNGAKMSVGRQINSKLSVAVGTNVKTGDSEFVTRYRLNRKIHVQTTTATDSNALDLFYTIEVGGVGELVDEIVQEDLKLINRK